MLAEEKLEYLVKINSRTHVKEHYDMHNARGTHGIGIKQPCSLKKTTDPRG